MKKILIGTGITIAIVIATLFIGVITTQNRAISLEELVSVTASDIQVQEKRRVDLVHNLVDTVKQYDKHEEETLENVVAGRGKQGDITDASTVISATAEAYPQLKADTNYKQLMTELSATENIIAEHRKTFNSAVKDYNRYIKKFPTTLFLKFTGYEKQNFEYLDFNASENAPTDLFGDRNE